MSDESGTDHPLLIALLVSLASIGGVLLLLMLAFLTLEAWPILSSGLWLNFFLDGSWYPLEGKFGALPMILASAAVTIGAIALALPLGVASAIFLEFYAPRSVCGSYRSLLNLLAGIPSVVFGLWGLTQLVPLITQWQPPGTSLLAAVLVLTFMILPTIALTSDAALHAVPSSLRDGAIALGMGRKSQILFVAIPAARNGILGGTLLAMARALGETLAVLMVAGNVVQYPDSLFASVRVLTANIALEMAYATDMHRSSLFFSGLLLTLLVLVLAWLASRFGKVRVF